MREGPIRVVVADDHRLFRQGLCALLSRSHDVEVVGEARDGEEAILVAREKRPDVLLLDLDMPILDGIAVTRMLTERGERIKVIILSTYEDERVSLAMRVGAAGYVAKRVDLQELIAILKSTVAGKVPLSPFLSSLNLGANAEGQRAHGSQPGSLLTVREREVLRLLVQGYSNREIARTAFMSPDTVKAYLKAIFEKLQVRNRTQAAVVALQSGLLGTSTGANSRP